MDQFLIPQAATGLVEHGGLALFVAERRLVRALGAERVVDVAHLQNSGKQRDLGAAQPVWISAAVPMLMMMTDDRQHVAQTTQWPADVLTGDGMLLHDLPLF